MERAAEHVVDQVTGHDLDQAAGHEAGQAAGHDVDQAGHDVAAGQDGFRQQGRTWIRQQRRM